MERSLFVCRMKGEVPRNNSSCQTTGNLNNISLCLSSIKLSISDRLRALTNRNSLITVGTRPSMFAAAAVITAEVPITLTGAVEETDGPSFPIVPSVVRVLRPMWARVHRDGHTLIERSRPPRPQAPKHSTATLSKSVAKFYTRLWQGSSQSDPLEVT